MERKNVVIDVSPFSLIEATGDSEADSDLAVTVTCDPGLSSSLGYGGGGGGGGGDHDEDAESCSSEWSSHELYNSHDVRDLDCGDTEARGGVDESYPWRRTRETGNYDRVEQRRRWWPEAEGPCVSEEINSFEEEEEEEINKKPSGIVSSEVHLSETEKSRLFWEACLAS